MAHPQQHLTFLSQVKDKQECQWHCSSTKWIWKEVAIWFFFNLFFLVLWLRNAVVSLNFCYGDGVYQSGKVREWMYDEWYSQNVISQNENLELWNIFVTTWVNPFTFFIGKVPFIQGRSDSWGAWGCCTSFWGFTPGLPWTWWMFTIKQYTSETLEIASKIALKHVVMRKAVVPYTDTWG